MPLPPFFLNNIPILKTDIYLGFHIDKRLAWNEHIKAKGKELNRGYTVTCHPHLPPTLTAFLYIPAHIQNSHFYTM